MEPEPEPIVEEVKQEELSQDLKMYVKDLVSTEEAAKNTAEKMRDQANTIIRLSAPMRPKTMSKYLLKRIL